MTPSYRRAECTEEEEEEEIKYRPSACSQQPSYKRVEEEEEDIQRRSSACFQ